MMFCLFQSCEKNDISFDLDLQAPSGEMIADDMTSFNREVSSVIEKIYGERKEFEIVKLEFLSDIPQGYLANIEYETHDGIRGNYFKVHGPIEYCVLTSGALVIPNTAIRLKSSSKSGETSGGSYYYWGLSKNECNGCKMVYNIRDGIQITCACDDGLGEGDIYVQKYYD
ncbi:MAG: hypothetical protein LBL33_05940 [Tannerella sp.]|jgi:hypothetical protein|nr:hypothetical protein [Tannerella sp.]